MWISELKTTYAFLSIVIIISNIVSRNSKTIRLASVTVQLLLVLGYVISQYGIYPHRVLFVLVTYTMTIVIFFPIRYLVDPAYRKVE